MKNTIYSGIAVVFTVLPVESESATLKYVGKNYTETSYSVGRDCTESVSGCSNDRGSYDRSMRLEFEVEIDGDLEADRSYELMTSSISDGIHFSEGRRLYASYPDRDKPAGRSDAYIDIVTGKNGRVIEWDLYLLAGDSDYVEVMSSNRKQPFGYTGPVNDYVGYLFEYQWCFPGDLGCPDDYVSFYDELVDAESSRASSSKPGVWYIANDDGSHTAISAVPAPGAGILLSSLVLAMGGYQLRKRRSLSSLASRVTGWPLLTTCCTAVPPPATGPDCSVRV